jgi:hypothetical protein
MKAPPMAGTEILAPAYSDCHGRWRIVCGAYAAGAAVSAALPARGDRPRAVRRETAACRLAPSGATGADRPRGGKTHAESGHEPIAPAAPPRIMGGTAERTPGCHNGDGNGQREFRSAGADGGGARRGVWRAPAVDGPGEARRVTRVAKAYDWRGRRAAEEGRIGRHEVKRRDFFKIASN